jgi:peptidoglycan/LPS O-acetylase OafA/YrhL
MIGQDTSSAPSPARNAGMDLLRGLSILLVVMHHVGLRIPLRKGVLGTFLPKWFLNALIYNGYEAVFIFFVLSGFLITERALARWGSLGTIDLRAFYLRRAARILPCLLLLVGVLGALHLAGVENYVISRDGQSLPGAIFAALALHLNWYEGQTGYLPGGWDVLWSLSIEEVFYLAFPLLCPLLWRWRLLVPSLAVLALSLPVTRAALAGNEIWQEKAYLPGMAGIATGVLAALIATRAPPEKRWPVRVLCVLGSLGIATVLFAEGALWPWLGNGVLLLLTSGTACLAIAFHWQARTAVPWTFRAFGWLRSFGRWSYEIYLTHMFVVFFVVGRFKAHGGDLFWGVLWYLPAVALSWLLGGWVARYVSNPSERALRGFLLRRTREPPAPLSETAGPR